MPNVQFISTKNRGLLHEPYAKDPLVGDMLWLFDVCISPTDRNDNEASNVVSFVVEIDFGSAVYSGVL